MLRLDTDPSSALGLSPFDCVSGQACRMGPDDNPGDVCQQQGEEDGCWVGSRELGHAPIKIAGRDQRVH